MNPPLCTVHACMESVPAWGDYCPWHREVLQPTEPIDVDALIAALRADLDGFGEAA